jgi:hypothetical protein
MGDFMDASLAYRLQDNIIFLKIEDDCSVQEFYELLKNALNDPRLPRRFGIIIDARHSAICPRIADLKQIHDELKKWYERIARMAVVVQSALHFGFIRQCSVYAEFEGQEINPFYKIEPAISWVNEKLKDDPAYNNTIRMDLGIASV